MPGCYLMRPDATWDNNTVAGKGQLTYAVFLAELLLAECDDRDLGSQSSAADFPQDRWFGDFDFEATRPSTPHHLKAQRKIP